MTIQYDDAAAMPSARFRFTSADGLSLFTRCWEPAGEPRAVLAVVHGVTEHSGRYQVLAEALGQAGNVVAAFDLRGHGRSAGRRGHVNSWPDYVDDVAAYCEHLRGRRPTLPLFLFGHSLGSLIALAFVRKQPAAVRGLILSGTAVDPVGVARPHLVAIAHFFSRVWPTFSVRIQSAERPKLSRDPAVDAAFLADPLVLKSVTARFGTEALQLIAFIKRSAPELRAPLLALHGDADPLNSLAGARLFFEQVASRDKQFIVYPDSLHEVYHDLDQVKVFADLRSWIEQRLGPE